MRRLEHELETVPFVLLALNTNNSNEVSILKANGFSNIVSCEGMWKGHAENSYAVFFNGPEQLQTLIHIAKQHDQEAILIVDSERHAKTFDLHNGEQASLGQFKSITKAEALLGGIYTYVPNMDTYFKAG